jgi:hypothetical protein
MPIGQASQYGPEGYVPATFFKPDDAIKAGTAGSVQVGNAAAFSAVSSMFAKLNDASMRSALTDGLHGIKPICDKTIANWADGNNTTGKCYDPHLVGIVIVEVVCVSSGPIGQGSTMQFWTVFYGDCGLNTDMDATIAHYLSDPSIRDGYPAIPDGSEARWLIFWYRFEIPKVTAVGTR